MRWTKHGALINGTQLLIAFDNVSDCSATAFKNKTFLRCAVEAPSLLVAQHAVCQQRARRPSSALR